MKNQSIIEELGLEIAELERELKRDKELRREAEAEERLAAYRERVSSASEMMQREYTDNDTLLDPILPRQGVVGLVGSSDSASRRYCEASPWLSWRARATI